MAAINLYTETFKMILNLRVGEDVSWAPIFESFCDLRESLLCAVCRKLTMTPYQRFTDHCSHNVCRDCLGGKLQTPCDWCANDKSFEDNMTIKILMKCYKNMCKYVMSSEFFRKSLLSDMSLSKLNFISKVSEGSKFGEIYHFSSPPNVVGQKLRVLLNVKPPNIKNSKAQKTVYRLHLNHEKVAVKTTMDTDGSGSKGDSSLTGTPSYIVQRSYIAQKQRNCHCGITDMLQRKLTCCGQKCPCFVAGRPCFNCRCRGCRNPQKYKAGPIRFIRYRPPSKASPSMNELENQAKTADEVVVTTSNE